MTKWEYKTVVVERAGNKEDFSFKLELRALGDEDGRGQAGLARFAR